MLSRITRTILASSATALSRQPLREVEGRSLSRAIHTSQERCKKDDKKDNKQSALVLHAFANAESKERETFLEILREYKTNNEMRRGHVEFIQVALKYMDEFGVNRDLAVYKDVLDVLPKGKFIPQNYFQTILTHYPKQQDVAIDLLCKMEHNTVIPDVEMQEMLLNIFGVQALVLKKFWRMMYWMPKFANLNPWPCPTPVPKDPKVLAKLAMNKISSADVQTEIAEFKTKDVEDAIDDTWIVSAMSSLQEELLQKQPLDTPIFVEGPFTVWVADHCIDYFILKGAPKEKNNVYQDPDDVSDIKIPFWDKKRIILAPTVHEQNDGTYFAMCATGTSTKDSLLSWIRCLQEKNPVLTVIPVVFKLMSSTREQLYIGSSENNIVQIKEQQKNTNS
ncbi:PREDICTED: evolutionarily conserved signaling intermediate in Toll pathway, mitochondrial [Trachymyrmex cornetzi]|uniref:Evolutionarily conserved signaling intermediate in Toll pathway, mitochondrial n=1 Tax=Trachymyrmex cornetzi TaxID=471704 RepID=A0A151J806_9HYME|nr:PREDICTED: evolutionarily conserved signaling intermediate in Toll pathway, mitochondrial [Trachymyrmex cornetzi]XP_018362139.1 PREDICTED: evolutionarily conserved signaling intermediate in Toll pathway, mitochondrial [Trachymyrmex cornetzi]KYN20530.1 Evolutionarily conserved signaling intermediate in Toll pathway, mitochondrial [Trachymyrmex cornetzi]